MIYRTENFMNTTGNSNNHLAVWEKLKRGDINTIEGVYNEYSHQLYQYGLKFTKNTQLIEDCIQDLFSRIITNYKNFGKSDNPKIYLIRAFRNNLFRLMEREKRYLSPKTDDYHFEILFSVESEIIESEETQRKETILKHGLGKLSSRQKEAIYLRYTKGLEYDEISGIMKMSIESCRNVIYKAIRSLREEINNSGIVLLLFFKKDTVLQ